MKYFKKPIMVINFMLKKFIEEKKTLRTGFLKAKL